MNANITDTDMSYTIFSHIISYLYYIQVNPVTGEKQVHRPLDIEHAKRQNKNAPTIIGTSPCPKKIVS
jgi:hypothetical protein